MRNCLLHNVTVKKEQDSYTTSLYWDTVLVEEYIYLSIHTEIRLSWKTNTETVYNKGINISSGN